MNERLIACTLASLLLVTADLSFAQSYPSKTVRIVIGYPAGGGVDFTARPIAQRLSERWGHSVIVDSRPGGSAMIGTDLVAKSAPDGYTMMLSASSEVSMNVALFKKMPYDPVRDLQPVTLIGSAYPGEHARTRSVLLPISPAVTGAKAAAGVSSR